MNARLRGSKYLPLMAAGSFALFWVACTAKAPEPEPVAAAAADAPAAAPKEPTRQPDTASATAHDDAPAADQTQTVRTKSEQGETAVELKAPEGWKFAKPPTTPDPHGGKFSLAHAVAGMTGKGSLVATISTSMGELRCDLFDKQAPITVANFVGLARGTRKYWDETKLAWVGKPFYDGLTFHRVIPGFMIQGGDHTGTGGGRIWYQIPDEVHASLKHDRAGLLCMANRGPNTNEAQFFLTDGPTPHLDGGYTIFGECRPTEVIYRIARVPQGPQNRPTTPVRIERVTVARVLGGAAAFGVPEPASGPLPDNKVPGVAPPGRVLRGDQAVR
jgi:peptidyl-prolyl cis-trans isomerase A (cyclophilin A)